MRYLFFVIFELLYLLSLLAGNIFAVVEMALLAVVLYLIRKVEKQNTVDAGLTNQEKYVILATEFLSPVVAGAFFYYCWRRKFPIKANWANRFSWIVVGLKIVLVVILSKFGVNLRG